jgi:hypothetical protein
MRQAGATFASVQSALAQANAGDTGGFLADCNVLPATASSAAPAAAPAQTVR